MKHKCIRFGPIFISVNGPIWVYSMDFGKVFSFTVWEKR